MENLKLSDVCEMARENNMRIIVKHNGYALCDDKLQTLIVTGHWRQMIWYINNCDILGIIKV